MEIRILSNEEIVELPTEELLEYCASIADLVVMLKKQLVVISKETANRHLYISELSKAVKTIN